jgi:hypothetical protein
MPCMSAPLPKSREARNRDLAQLLRELSAVPTRAEATDIFWGADWIFVNMDPLARERAYEQITDIIGGKPC